MKQDFLYNNKIFRDRCRDLRNNQTEEEKILWSKLKNKQIREFKFVRQYSVGPYILDFYCPKIRLAIELDGTQHKEKEAILYDQERNNYLEAVSIKTVRFWNSEVQKDIEGVVSRIIPLLI